MSLLANGLLNYAIVGGCTIVLRTALDGNIVRVRAQYTPKALQLEAEEDQDVIGVSYSRMTKRVIRVEGWSGLLRGIVPLAFTACILSMWCPLEYNCMVLPHFLWSPILDAVARYCIFVLYGVPFTIFFVRSITTPERLSFFNIQRAFRALLSPSERRHPSLLYLTPGLFLLSALEHAWDVLITPDVAEIVARFIPALPFPYSMSKQAVARLSLAFLHAVVLGPLEVIKVRLAVQRHEDPTVTRTQDVLDGEQLASTTEAPSAVAVAVVRLRTDSDRPAYSGMLSCLQIIVSEEGFETLYRAWWYTLFISLVKFQNLRL